MLLFGSLHLDTTVIFLFADVWSIGMRECEVQRIDLVTDVAARYYIIVQVLRTLLLNLLEYVIYPYI